MIEEPPEPPTDLADSGVLVARYLDWYREIVWAKVDGWSEAELRRPVLPSGWSALELLQHLGYAERRWLQWCFLAAVEELPRGDHDPATGRWSVPPELDRAAVRAAFDAEADRTRRVVAEHPLDTVAARRRAEDQPPPTLAWILFHLLQEYARHAGHLDAVVELVAAERSSS